MKTLNIKKIIYALTLSLGLISLESLAASCTANANFNQTNPAFECDPLAYTNGGTYTVNNAGNIGVGNAGTSSGIYINGGSYVSTVTNTGSILGEYAFLVDTGHVGTITNGSTTNSTALIGNIGAYSSPSSGYSFDTINNYGSINSSGASTTAIYLSGAATLNIINNYGSGTIQGDSVNGGSYSGAGNAIELESGASINAINNSGLIKGVLLGSGIYLGSGTSIGTITNNGSSAAILGGSGYYGINNFAGTITTLNNAQGGNSSNAAQTALTYNGTLPTNYNIIINSGSYYGQLAVTGASGATTFGIYSPSGIITQTTYNDVISGVTSSNFSNYASSGYWGTFGLAQWKLVSEGGSNPNNWDLVFSQLPATNITTAGTVYQSSNLGTSVNPVFDGGTLQVSGAGTIANNFTVNANNGVIDQNGSASIFSGVISDAVSGTPGSMTVINTSNNGGSVTFTGNNTYTGSTTINSGAKLALSGTGSIATSSGVINNGAFDISATTSGATVKAISGTGTTNLGSQNLAITNASGNLSGAVTGTGGINITGGNQTLSGNNSGFSGGVQVQSGAALTIPAASALGTGSLALVGSSSVPATLNVTGTTTIANAITVAGDPVFNIATGTTTTVSSPITNGGATGDVVVAGGGTLNLTAVNTYTGLTAIGAGSTLALTGAGSITPSVSVTNNGIFNVSNKTGNVALGGSFTQTSTGGLVMGFAPTSNQRVTVAGAAALAGSLNLVASGGTYSAGKYTLLTANGVSGTFGSFSSNLNTYTNLAYSLSYDANDVYLNMFTNGPSTANTQQSLTNTVQAVQSTFTILNTALANSFSYDCNEFGANGICISAGGRNTAVSAANGLNNTSALLIAAYRPHPNYRIGAYADQNLSVNNAGSTVNLGNNTPLVGLFGAWTQNLDGTGTEVKVSAAYGQKNTTVTRQVVGTGSTASESGSGGAPINSQGAQVTAKYGFGITENVIVSPYLGMRYTQNNMNGYTEGSNSSVTAPLTYSSLNTNATTALAGVGVSYHFIPKATVFASAGVETDTNTSNGTYSATGVAGLTSINFNANPVKTRPTAMLGAYYDVMKNQRLGVTGIYRQEPYQGVSTTTVMATYTIGM